jgi:hypothetical protein
MVSEQAAEEGDEVGEEEGQPADNNDDDDHEEAIQAHYDDNEEEEKEEEKEDEEDEEEELPFRVVVMNNGTTSSKRNVLARQSQPFDVPPQHPGRICLGTIDESTAFEYLGIVWKHRSLYNDEQDTVAVAVDQDDRRRRHHHHHHHRSSSSSSSSGGGGDANGDHAKGDHTNGDDANGSVGVAGRSSKRQLGGAVTSQAAAARPNEGVAAAAPDAEVGGRGLKRCGNAPTSSGGGSSGDGSTSTSTSTSSWSSFRRRKIGVPNADPMSLAGSLNRLMEPEKLPEDYKCQSCKAPGLCARQMTLWSLPDFLVIQVKRFQYTSFVQQKIRSFVRFDLRNFDLSPWMSDNHKAEGGGGGSGGGDRLVYDLYAVVNHRGGLSSGHYTTFALNTAAKECGQSSHGACGTLQNRRLLVQLACHQSRLCASVASRLR